MPSRPIPYKQTEPRWAFAEFTYVFDIEPNLRQVIDSYSMTAVH